MQKGQIIRPPTWKEITVDVDENDQTGAKQIIVSWVLYIHGFNQSFPKNLEECHRLQQRYKTNVIAFSWPSGERVSSSVVADYKQARRVARLSSGALDRVLETLQEYIKETIASGKWPKTEISLNLMAHSLGNFLVESYIKDSEYEGETRIFDTVILHQADVDSAGHETWVERIESRQGVVVTINVRDSILHNSSIINSNRLGGTTPSGLARNATYLDCSFGKGVGATHNLFIDAAEENPQIQALFDELLEGGQVVNQPGFERTDDQYYRITPRQSVLQERRQANG